MRVRVASEQRIAGGDVRGGCVGGRCGDFAADDVVACRQTHRTVGIDLRRQRVVIADRAADEHRHCVILGNGDHVDAALVAIGVEMRGTGGRAGVGDRVAAFCAHGDVDVEEAAVDADIRLFCSDIGGRSVNADGARLHDPRRDQRDIGAAGTAEDIGVDRAVDGDRRRTARRAVEADRAVRAEQAAGSDDVVRREQQAADVDHAARADQDAAGVVEPDIAAAWAGGRSDIAVHGAIECDLAAQRSAAAVHEAVEDGIVAGADEIHILASGQKIDRAAGRRGVGRHPVDDALRTADIHRRRVGRAIVADRAGARYEAARTGDLRWSRAPIGKRSDTGRDRATGQQALLAFVDGRYSGGGTHGSRPRSKGHG